MSESEEMSFENQEAVEKVAFALRRGGVILYPTDTIWGLGCDIHNVSAVKRIYTIKQRPEDKPLILMVSSINMLKEYISFIHPRVETLLLHHVQPLTIIYSAGEKLPPHLVSTEGTIAIRVTHNEFCKNLIDKIKQPLISTSANVSESDFPTAYDQIQERIIEMADHIVDQNINSDALAVPSVLATFNHKGELDFIRS